MVKKFLLLSLALFGMGTGYSAQISVSEAKIAAERFMRSSSIKHSSGMGGVAASSNLSFAYSPAGDAGEGAYYVFNRGKENGYVVIAGDDLVPEVLGYADSGSFDFNTIPDNMKWWLQEYQRQIEYVQANPGTVKVPAARTYATSVSPLLGQIMWNQSAPYNNLCPTFVDSSDGKTYRSVTGCVATAMAQVMGYHKWPIIGTGSKSYSATINDVADAQTLEVNFGETTYDWDNIKPYHTSANTDAENTAIATLLYHCGVSVNMSYGSSSGAMSLFVPNALVSYFGYDKGMRYCLRSYYNAAEWDAMLHSELDAARPVYYTGRSSAGGHAFVFDGYNTDGYYHINWGWGGVANGYFRSLGLNPSTQGIGSSEGGYNSGQSMIIGIQPAVDNSQQAVVFLSDGMSLSNTHGKVDEVFDIALSGLFSYSNSSVAGIIQMALYNDATGEFINYQEGLIFPTLPPCYGWNNINLKYTVNASSDLPDGTYRIVPRVLADDATEPCNILFPKSTAQYVLMTKTGNDLTLSLPETGNPALEMTAATSEASYRVNTASVIKASIKNNGSIYYNKLSLAVLNASDNTIIATSDPVMTHIDRDATYEAVFSMTMPSATGDYRLAVLDADGAIIGGDPVDITVLEAEDAAFLNIVTQLAPENSKMPASDIRATITVSNIGGTFRGILQAFILKSGSNTIDGFLNSDNIVVNANETKTVTLSGTTTSFAAGDEVSLRMRYPNDLSKYYVWGNAVTFTIGDEITTGVSTATATQSAVYPNPASDNVTVTNPAGMKSASIYSMTGALVMSETVNGETVANLNVSSLVQGMYVLRVTDVNGNTTATTLVKK